MTKSMTSFGRARSKDGSEKVFSIEMKSVNHRYLDINIRMPKFMFSLEEKLRSIISSQLNRGKVDVFINFKSYSRSNNIVSVDGDLAKSYYEALTSIGDLLNIENDITISKISRFPDVLNIVEKEEDLEETFNEMKELLNEALNSMIEMREKEGNKLKEDILLKLEVIEKLSYRIEEIADRVPKVYKEKIEDRIKELVNLEDIDKTRLAMEVAILADKATVDEEIIRLRSHLIQMRNTLSIDESIGRKLDFIVQEMNREANTIASKSSDIEMINFVIEIKNIIEKIREQIQNIE
ncbi:YicC/YloC family endoribonuclease [uncultured Clostridium sp.]|uniref:YicC/YloC family endoribonuclease n=1 Tax=uncultured Clostridium sp. TaxID=59620 RepID=UPI002620F9FF|nr:YicC/YloC family endoribonuclease [uncultured Clostridium sp.]